MTKSVYKESKFFIITGLFLLILGSALLLGCKLPLPDAAITLAAFAGGGILLLGNGLIIYGLLIFTGTREE